MNQELFLVNSSTIFYSSELFLMECYLTIIKAVDHGKTFDMISHFAQFVSSALEYFFQ